MSETCNYDWMYDAADIKDCPRAGCGGTIDLLEPRSEEFDPLDNNDPLDKIHSCNECMFYKQLSEDSHSDYWEAQS